MCCVLCLRGQKIEDPRIGPKQWAEISQFKQGGKEFSRLNEQHIRRKCAVWVTLSLLQTWWEQECGVGKVGETSRDQITQGFNASICERSSVLPGTTLGTGYFGDQCSLSVGRLPSEGEWNNTWMCNNKLVKDYEEKKNACPPRSWPCKSPFGDNIWDEVWRMRSNQLDMGSEYQ